MTITNTFSTKNVNMKIVIIRFVITVVFIIN